ncbi:wax ester synthase/diacylglycerol acyltransferase 4-like [Telopea speciosissima]|uniref:wax ester synthase/diacylglycerol acyltransferase 4-like n=1 Tax=Telopea speciosissima TaxID=54955 RepID=UPI001CC82D2F|nr:wax ester synthase/diacylglycerol acyltransferase 4-like [Telopea speciosissima]
MQLVVWMKAAKENHKPSTTMASKQQLQGLATKDIHGLPPLSPISQSFSSPILSLTSILVLELDIPFTKSEMIHQIREGMIPINPRISSMIVADKKGVQRWKHVEPTIENHVVIPTFPAELSLSDYDKHFGEYLSEVAMDKLPEGRPPWEIHMFMYPTSNGAQTLIFKLSHALGDGYSIMSAVFSWCKRVDDPSLPIIFPSLSGKSPEGGRSISSRWYRSVSRVMSKCLNTVSDSVVSLLQGTVLEDSKTAIRSGTLRVELQPVEFSSVTFPLEHIRRVKSKVGATVNDVVIGLISYTIQLYTKRMTQQNPCGARVNALVILNMRMLRGYKRIEDMLKSNNVWGNHCSFLNIPIPSFSYSENLCPLNFIVKAKTQIKRKRNSAAIYVSGKILNLIKSVFGREAGTRFIHSTLKNTSIGISNLIGPTQKISLSDHPINGMYFSVVGAPQSVFFTIVSYMGELRVVMRTEKGFIDANMLVSCMKDAYEKIFEAACGKESTNCII